MINLLALQKKIDETFVLNQYKVKDSKLNSGGFFVESEIVTKTFIEWIESHYDVRIKNIKCDSEKLGNVKVFFEEVKI